MHPDQSPQLLLQRSYPDIDDWGREVGWDASFTQIDSGNLTAKASARGTTTCIATHGEFSHGVHQIGMPPKRMLSFGLPDHDVGEFRWCGKTAAGGDILNFNLASGFEGTTPSGFSGFVISFSDEFLRETIESQDTEPGFVEQIRGYSVWGNVGGATRTLRRQLSAYFHESHLDDYRAAVEFSAQAAAARLLTLICRQPADERPVSSRHRQLIVRRAMEWIAHRENYPVSVSELSRATGASAPTLYRAFMKEFGIGPKKYLNLRRLTRVRAELVSSDPDVCIAEIANGWGFWHMGQFAADYRRHFGELPSQTRVLRASTGRQKASVRID